MYRVLDSYGTHKTCWTWREALSWLRYCSPDAVITNRFTGKQLAGRSYRRAAPSPTKPR